MKREQIEGIVRHVLTFVGGILVIQGVVEESLLNEVIGAAVTLAGTLWSIFSKK
jgi:sorbitol-specific phosphotransferase system component IIBC